MEFDAIGRFLQDVGNDDTDDAGFQELGFAWVARRALIKVESFPTTRSLLELTTWAVSYTHLTLPTKRIV